jgi:mannose/fructose/N-acetylgalactosamine-specific phosphotransferase system component IIC
MIPDLPTLALVTLLGGLIALDATSMGQFMLSRPFIAAGIGGMVAGSPEGGIVIGLLLEALHLAVLPVGASRYPEAGPAATAAAAAYAGAAGSEKALLAAVLFALLWGWVSGRSVEAMRRLSVRLAVPAGAEGVSPAAMERGHLAAVGVDFARGALMTLAGTVVLGVALETLGWVPFREPWTRPALALSAAAALAASLRLFGLARLPWFAAGAAAGVTVVLLR